MTDTNGTTEDQEVDGLFAALTNLVTAASLVGQVQGPAYVQQEIRRLHKASDGFTLESVAQLRSLIVR